MDVVLNITAPIFFLILLGFVGTKYQLLSTDALPALSKFVLYFALPSVMVTKISSLDLRAVVDLSYMGVYAIGGLTAFSLTLVLVKSVLKESWGNGAVSGIGAMMPNSSFIGFPILLQYLDNAPAQAFAMSLVVENILFLPVGLIVIESLYHQESGAGRKVLLNVVKRIATNPIIMAVFTGVIMSLLGVHLPNFMGGGLDLLASAAAPCALIVIGGSLVGVVIRGSKTRTALVASVKLVIFPLVVFAGLQAFPTMPFELKASALLFAAMPMFSIYPIIGETYGQRSFCASTLMITTIFSFFTISGLLYFLH